MAIINMRNLFALNSFRNISQIFWENRADIESKYLGHVFGTLLTSALTSPFRAYERLRFQKIAAQTPIEHPPIFIVGYWRSGTTHLHNLISKDPQFGYVSMFQAVAPEFFLMGDRFIKPIVTKIMPPTRPMDKVALSVNAPQEEEVAIVNMCPYSSMYELAFPKKAHHYFSKYALFNKVSEKEKEAWKQIYLQILRKATYNMDGKQLVLKSPGNTGRVSLLLELFPNAKFIYIYRNPYDVFLSLKNFYRKLLPAHQLHDISQAQVEKNILQFYRLLMQKYEVDKQLIPTKNYVSVQFEQLERQPVVELKRIYQNLDLGDFKAVQPLVQDYLDSISTYKKNQYQHQPEDIQRVNQHWAFAFGATYPKKEETPTETR